MTSPRVARILETALYADDLARARTFYRELFGFEPLVDTPRLCALDVNGQSILLLFQRGATAQGLQADGGFIPPHDGSGPSHVAFAIASADLSVWEARLESRSVVVESRVVWERSGTSLYFRDPDGHSVELVTEGTWRTY